MAAVQSELPRVVGIREMSDILEVNPATLRRLLADGQGPPCFRAGRQIRFPLGEMFDAWCREQCKRQLVAS
jgi:hypothetical protein